MSSGEQEPIEYEVERILNKRILKDSTIEYLIKWKDYPMSQNTWEPLANLSKSIALVKRFEREENKKQSKKQQFSKNVKQEVILKREYKEQKQKKEAIETNEIQIKKSIEYLANGSFEAGDRVNQILRVIQCDSYIDIFVTWKKRKNEKTPQACWVSSSEMKQYEAPLFSDYLYSKIKLKKIVGQQ